MKKNTLIASLALAFASLTANATDKFFYRIANDKDPGWSIQDVGNFAGTPGNDFYSAINKKNGGRMLNFFYPEAAWSKINLENLPNKTYKWSMDLNMATMATRSDLEFVLLPVGACGTNDARITSHNFHWFNANENEDFFFRFRCVTAPAATNGDFTIVLNEAPTARNDWSYSSNPDSLLKLSCQTKYRFEVEVNTEDNVATYTITNTATEAVVKTGSHHYVCSEDRIGMQILSMNGSNSNHQLSNMGLSYFVDGAIAENPSLDLFYVLGAERDYFASFKEGEVLHWIQLGDAEGVDGTPYVDGQEYTVAYNDAMDTRSFDMGEEGGHKIIYCNASGQLKVWTTLETDENNASDEIVADVVCEAIKLPAPVAKITNVSAGYAKEYTLSVDNSDVLLKPTITIHYKLTQGSDVKQGDVLSGEKINFTGVGTLELYSTDKGAKTPRYTNSETSTIVNDVEYEEALVKDFVWTKEKCDGDVEGFTKLEIIDNANKSHWDRIYSNQTYGYDKDNAIVYNDGTYADGKSKADVVLEKAGFGFYDRSKIGTTDAKWNVQVPLAGNLRDAFFPLIPAAEDYSVYTENAWSIFPCEGIVYYATAGGLNSAACAEMNIAPYFVSDNESKPNFYIVTKRGGYDRPDKGNCESTDVVVAGEKFNLYRYDSAIREVRILVYKGFDWTTSIAAPSCVLADDADAPIYTLSGVQVKDATAPGIYVKNGKKFIVK